MMENFDDDGIEVLAGLLESTPDFDIGACPVWDDGETKADFVKEMRDYCIKMNKVLDYLDTKDVEINPLLKAWVGGNAETDINDGAPEYPQYNFDKIQNNLMWAEYEYDKLLGKVRNA